MDTLAWRWAPLFALVTCLLPVVAAGAPDAKAQVDARGWLARIQAAANGGNYRGVMVFSVSGTMSSTRVAHFAVGDQTYELLEALDGRQQRTLRHNDLVQTVMPQQRVAVLERREALGSWSSTPQVVEPQALEQYEFRREGTARVADRDAVVILLEPRDTLRYAQRLWADQASGLMLRADVLGLPAAAGTQRDVLESTAFSEVAVGVKPQPELVLQELRNPKRLDGYRVLRPQQQRSALEAEGWELKRPVPGFRLAGCVRRGIDSAGDDVSVLQAVFSDGLTHVSLFIEPFQAQRHSEMRATRGATSTLMQRRGGHWFTVVGDVPPATLKLFAEAVERRP